VTVNSVRDRFGFWNFKLIYNVGNRYLLSSTTFSPPLFLSQVHHDATTEDLIRGLNFLSQSIEKKSASLKVLVESNFEKFVRAKATIDNVYREMVSPGEGSNGGPPPTTKKAHSRQASRQSMTHLRKTSGSISLAHTEKRKNALVKEQDYGILPIKIPLLELKAKIDEVWGPALGGRERESYLNVLTTSIEKQRSIFEIGGTIAECIKRREHDTLVDEYTKARRLAEDSRILLESASKRNAQLSDQDVLQIVMTARMWSDVEDQIEGFKRDVWRRLAGTHFIKQQIQEENKAEEYVELIKVLLELGVEDNPIWVWLFSRYDYLKQKIVGTFERSKVEIEILRRRLSYGEKPTDAQIALHLRAATSDGRVRSDAAIDSAKVIEVWEHIFSCLNTLLSTQGGILGEILEFWETAQSFIDGKAQRSLPAGIDGRSRKHHRLSTDGVKTISGGAQDLVNTIRDSIQSFFNDLPTEDLSLLLSPIPATPLTPKTPKTPKSATFQSFTDNRLRIDVSNIPPPSPRKGDSWEQYAFWPPHANSLSGVYYLTKILNLVATASCDMAGVKILDEKSKSIDSFKILVGSVRDRCVQAACAAWNSDCERANVLEDWTRALERSDLTNFPSRLMNFEGFLLNNFQKMLYISEATKRPSSPDIITPPPSKLLQMVRNNFVGGLYKVISGMKENAKSESPVDDDSSDGLVTPMPNATAANTPLGLMDSSNKVYLLYYSMLNLGLLLT
jgi:exocyst complex component 2